MLQRWGQKLTRILFGVFLVFLFFPKREFLFLLDNNASGQVIPSFAWWYYFIEILIPIVLIGFLVFFKKPALKIKPKFIWTALGVSLIGIFVGSFFHTTPHFDFLVVLRIVEFWCVSYLVAVKLLPLKTVLSLLLLSISLQALLGGGQFFMQSSLGLSQIGESSLSADTLGIAKIDIGEDKYIRPVGTMTHANAWGMIMLIGIGLILFWKKEHEEEQLKISLEKARRKLGTKEWVNTLGYIMGGVFALGIILSFSRSAWAGLMLVLLALILKIKRKWFAVGASVLAVGGIILFQFPLMLQRVSNWFEAFVSRGEAFDYAWKIIAENPYGVGAGRFGLEVQQIVSDKFFAPWEIQPVHNVLLLAGAELGWFFLIMLSFFGLWQMVRAAKSGAIWFAVFLAVLISLNVDHFFWTDFSMATVLVVFLTVFELEYLEKKIKKF